MKNILIYLAILFVLISIVIWLNQNHFFLCLKNSDFNNLLTPIISLFSVILLIFILSDSQKFNSRQLSINEYNILLQDFELVKTNLEKLTFNVDLTGFSDGFENRLDESNGIEYISLFSEFFYFNISNNQNEKDELINKFRHGIIYPLIRNYRNLEIFLKEVVQNDILNDRYKKKFYLKVEQLLLQNYFRICNNIDPIGNLSYNLELFDTKVFKSNEFKEINEMYRNYNLFQIHDIEFYKKTL